MRNRRRDARHPVVLATFGGLGYIAAAQLATGPGGSAVIQAMSLWSQRAFSLMLMGSVFACIASAWVGHEPRGAKLERAGMIGAGVALLFYTFNIPDAVSQWASTMGVVFGATAAGCAVRAGLVWRMIRHRETW